MLSMKVLAWPAFKNRYQNPYNWLLYSSMAKLGVKVEELSPLKLLLNRYDVVHLHWPVETIVRTQHLLVAWIRVLMFIGLLRWQRWRGSTIVWTIHDQRPHVLLHPKLAQRCEAWLIESVDALVNLCAVSQQIMSEQHPKLAKKLNFIIPHGHYRDSYPNQISKIEAKAYLKLPQNSRVLLYLGYISPYKNVPLLIQEFSQIQDSEFILVIAGKPDDEFLEQKIKANANSHVHLHLRFIHDEDLQIFYNAADLVVLPFQATLNSGSVLLALSFSRPVLVPHIGAFPEWQAHFGETWVRTYRGSITAEILLKSINNLPLLKMSEQPNFELLEWSAISTRTVEVYQELKETFENS